MFDIVIKNGSVIDGTGNPKFKSDIAVEKGKIAKVAFLDNSVKASKTIDATGKIVCPGFIDAHNHSDHTLFANGRGESFIRQGATTLIVGNCGFSMGPVVEKYKEELKRYLAPFVRGNVKWNWHTMGEFFDRIEESGLGLNIASFVGHGAIRLAVMGFENREPASSELDQMKELLRQSLRDGAIGLSTGLGYPPGVFSKTEELVELSKVVRELGRLYDSDMRLDGWGMDEVFEIGKKTGASVHISHLGSSSAIRKIKNPLEKMNQAVKEVDITADVYPYSAGQSFLKRKIPEWVHEGGIEKMISRLKDKDVREKIKVDKAKQDWEKLFLAYSPTGKNRRFEGKNFKEISSTLNLHPVDALCNILIDENGDGTMVEFWGEEKDIIEMMRHPLVMFGSDGWAFAPYGELSKGKPHPRAYGTFPRVLGKYVREMNMLTWEEAIRKMTSFPARKMGLKDRGLMLEGMSADIVIFDPNTIIDKATYTDPHQYPSGIDYVLVNGILVIDKGEHTGAMPGKVLRKVST